jgi:mannose-6-phosphate isomerase-like protein (cupin superfamily)
MLICQIDKRTQALKIAANRSIAHAHWEAILTDKAKPVRRVIADHDDTGKAVITMDGPAPQVIHRAAANLTTTLVWTQDKTPADVDSKEDMGMRQVAVAPPANGHVCRVVEFPPVKEGGEGVDNAAMLKEMGIDQDQTGGKPPRNPFMHRTKSIDYAIILEGEIDMLLDDSEVHLKQGDILVQKATNHAWVNNGSVPCRICFVLIDAVEPQAWKLNPVAGH